MRNALIAMLKSQTAIPPIDGIRPTEIERLMGRLMRAPDHDAGGVDAGDGAGDQAADAPSDTPSEGAGGDADGEGGDATIIGQAAAKTDAGKDGEGGDADKGGDDKADTDDKDGDKADGPPEAYDLKLTIKDDEGNDQEVEIDAALVEAATPLLKEVELTNEEANKLIPLVPVIQRRMREQDAETHEEMSAGWAKSCKADKEIGGKNWEQTEHLVGKAIDKFGNPELTDVLEQSRLGNHPGFVKMMRAIGASLGEDEQFPRGGGPTEKVDTAALHYPEDVPAK